MPTYIALLRGINVSGQKKIIMKELKVMFQELGYEEVITYIQSGNIIFKTRKTAEKKLEQTIKAAIEKTFGFDVPTMVLTKEELESLAQANPYKDREVEHKFLHLLVLSTPPDPEKIKMVEALEFPGEEFTITERVVYLFLPNGSARTKLSTNFFESKLKVKATGRNLRSTNKLIELANKN